MIKQVLSLEQRNVCLSVYMGWVNTGVNGTIKLGCR